MNNNKTTTLGDILGETGTEIALDIFRKDRANFRRRVRDEVILPRMHTINAITGQENDADYLAYAAEYALGKLTAS